MSLSDFTKYDLAVYYFTHADFENEICFNAFGCNLDWGTRFL